MKKDIPKKYKKLDKNVKKQNKHSDSTELSELEKDDYFLINVE